MRKSNSIRLCGLSLMTIAVLLTAQQAQAQSAGESIAAPSNTGVADIVVTAQKRNQNLQDVGVSVAAIGGAELRKLAITDSKDISKLAAGVTLDSTAGGGINANLTVRGISQSDFSSIQESPNSIYIDDVYESSSNAAAFTLYDLDRVEVLRGPQGTLFGRASSGGLANFITAKPSHDWQGYAELGFGSYGNAYAEAAVGGPISDTIRFRISGRREIAEGWFKNELPGGKDAFATDFYGIRGQLEADLAPNFTARLSVSYDRDPKHAEGIYKEQPYYITASGLPGPLPANLDAWGTGPGNDMTGYRDPYPSFHEGAFNSVGYLKNERFSPTLNLSWKLGGATITSITNYTHFKFDYREDCDGGPVDYCNYGQGQNLKQFSQEIRANGHSGPIDYTVGAYYLHVKQIDPMLFVFPALSGTSFAYNDYDIMRQTTKSYAAFGQIEYQFAEKWKFTFGARYTHDEKTFDQKVYFNELGTNASFIDQNDQRIFGTGVYSPSLLGYNFSCATVGDLCHESANLYSGKVQVDYKPVEHVLLYASASRGVKGPGFNSNISALLQPDEVRFGSERLYAYEAGAKTEMFDRRLRINASAFYYDYHHFQGYAYAGLQGIVGNYNGYFTGGELEVTAAPVHNLDINLGVSYLKNKIRDVATAYEGIRDEKSISAPKWTANATIDKTFDTPKGPISLIWSGNYISSRYASLDNNPATYLPGSFEHNARIMFKLQPADVEFSVFINNISNKARENFVYDFTLTTGAVVKSYDRPRWIGGSIRKTF